jgi:ribosomal protein L37E
MSVIDEIFSEYKRMRQGDLDSKASLRALRIYIEPLPRKDKEELASRLRDWERHQGRDPEPEPRAPSRSPSSVIRPLKGSPAAGKQLHDDTWVECQNCGAKNRAEDVFCYACGHMLENAKDALSTKHFASATDELFSNDYFGPDSVLILDLRDQESHIALRPQTRSQELVLGRSTQNTAMRPDVDLSRAQAEELGVSRLHLSLTYDRESNTLQISDLGSSNGTFVNGQKLHPKELRILRHGDDLRLARLAMRVRYQHPGEEIQSE